VRKSLYFSLIPLLLLVLGCKKEEGRGGKFSIKGKVYALFYDENMAFKTGEGYLADHDVFIIYGDADSYGDKISTSADGSFEFNFLRKGTYTIFTYSKDTAGISSSGEVAVSVEVTISGDKELEDLRIVEEERKLFRIRGKIKAQYIGLDRRTINSEAYVADHDVFAVNLANPSAIEKVSTNTNGEYEFNALPSGNYKIYTKYKNFQGDVNGDDVIISKDTTIAGSGLTMPDLVVKLEDNKLFAITGNIEIIEIDNFGIPITTAEPAGDIDVYIVYGTDTIFGDRTRTTYNGNYQFWVPNGTYEVYAYSDDELLVSVFPIAKKRSVIVNNSNVSVPKITIYD
jgi:hypothetical protein